MTACPRWADDAAEHKLLASSTRAHFAIREALAAARTKQPNRGEIARWHRRMFEHSVPLPCYAGGYRQVAAAHPCLAVDVAVTSASSRLPGAPHDRVLDLMAQLIDFLRPELASIEVAWPTLGPDARAERVAKVIGVAVGAFVRIHPFVNGNGRTSRLLWKALLTRLGLPSRLTVIRRPSPPYDAVMAAAMTGDYGPAVEAVLRAMAVARAGDDVTEATS